jgi:hypothetical protein
MFKAQEMAMKKFMTVAALATILASPALAQSYSPDLGTGNIVPNYSAQAGFNPEYAPEFHAFARVPHRAKHRRAVTRHAR